MQRTGAGGGGPRDFGPSSPLPEPLEVALDLWALGQALSARSRWMRRSVGLTGPQRLVARFIGMAPGCSPGDAARQLRLHPASVTRLVVGLEAHGMVRRERDRSDARRLRLSLTSRGVAATSSTAGSVEEAAQRALAATARGDVAAARAFLRLLTAELAPAGEVH